MALNARVPPSCRCRAAIDKLKKDNDTLKEDLALETKQAMQSNSAAAAAQIAKLQDQADTYTRKIEMEKRRISELDNQIKIMQSNILEQRRKMGGVNAAKENHAQIQKQIKILENRLDKVRPCPTAYTCRPRAVGDYTCVPKGQPDPHTTVPPPCFRRLSRSKLLCLADRRSSLLSRYPLHSSCARRRL